jgi:hypothetical protein
MKTKIFFLMGIALWAAGCERDPLVNPGIAFVNGTHCKNLELKSVNDQPSDRDCIQYRWVEGDSLIIKHVNAAFNCCPDGFNTDLVISGDTLIITETENEALCDCNCLYDLNYVLTGIEKDTWWIRIDEQYARQPDDKKIVFKVNLRKEPLGEFCVTRTGYPWKL